jgi:hypothetical protein
MKVLVSSKLAALGTAALLLGTAAGASPTATAKRPLSGPNKRSAKAQGMRLSEMKVEVPGPAFEGLWHEFASRAAGAEQPLFTRFSAMTGAPRVIYGDLGEAPPAAKVGDRAMLFLQAHAHVLGIDTTKLEATRSVEHGKANHYYFNQKFEGLPVFYGRVSVHIDGEGRVRGVTNTFAPVTPKSLEPGVTAEAAFDAAVAAVGIKDRSALIAELPVDKTVGIWPTAGGGALAYRIAFSTREPAGYFEVIVDAQSGDILEEPRNLMSTIDGTGKVFTPSPVVTEANDLLRDNGDGVGCATCPPEASYRDVVLPNLNGSGRLIGTYSQIHESHATPAQFADNNFSNLRRNQNEFNQEQVYWAIDKAATTFQSLGHGDVMNYSIKFYAHNSPTWGNQDNSSFSGDNNLGPGTGLLQFGTGGVDDAEDSEIVWHEYGHATLWNQVPGMNQNVTREGIGEGFGDYLAGTMSKRVPGDPSYHVTVGEWDAVSYNPNGSPHPNLRPLNNPTFWENRGAEVHDAGEVWSHPLFDYDNQVGPDLALKTILESHFLYDLNPSQVEGANALLTADAMINGGGTTPHILNAFRERHTLAGTVVPVVHTIGVVPAGSAAFFLRNSLTPGPGNVAVSYGSGADTPIVGDWDGNGTDTLGRFRQSTGTFFLKNTNAPGAADLLFRFGPVGTNWLPVVGDWDGNGTETIGLYDPASSTFFLKNTNTPGPADLAFRFGPVGGGFLPIAGDWDGVGGTGIGIYNPANGAYFLKNVPGSGAADLAFLYGTGGGIPVAGDWDGNGTDTVGFYAAIGGQFYLTNVNATGPAHYIITYGPLFGTPVIGDWNGGLH